MNYLTTAASEKQITKLEKKLPQALILYGRTQAYLRPIAHHIALRHTPHIFTITAQEGRQAIAIAQIREIIAQTAKASIAKEPRVYILADSLSHDAYHATLKLLEEVPENCYFIMITESLHGLPATIISRCHGVHIAAPSPREIETAAHQKGILDQATIKQLQFIADILPEDLPQLIEHPETMQTVASKVVEAKNFLTANRTERFGIVKKYHTKKETLADFTTILAAILHRQAQSQPDILTQKAHVLTRVTNALSENAAPKIVAAYLAWHI